MEIPVAKLKKVRSSAVDAEGRCFYAAAFGRARRQGPIAGVELPRPLPKEDSRLLNGTGQPFALVGGVQDDDHSLFVARFVKTFHQRISVGVYGGHRDGEHIAAVRCLPHAMDTGDSYAHLDRLLVV